MYAKTMHPLGFIQATPTPSKAELQDFYANKYYQGEKGLYRHSYPEAEILWFKNKALLAEQLFRRHTTATHIALLDVGCGEGFFARHFYDQIIPVEVWDYANYGLQQYNPELLPHFRQGDVFDLLQQSQADAAQYTWVNLSNVLEHVIDPLGLLTALRARIAPGGVLRICVPNDYSAFQALLVESGCTSDTWFVPPEHLNYFNQSSLAHVTEHCGYRTLATLAEFPIEQYLLNPETNYWRDKTLGKAAHHARVTLDNFLIETDLDGYIDYASAAARLGFGRQLVTYLTPA